MILTGAEILVLVATKPVDFRKQADGLAALVQQTLSVRTGILVLMRA